MPRTLVGRLALVLAPLVLSALPATATPPQPPLELALRLVEPVVPGQPVRFIAEVTPRVNVAHVRLTVVPPPGVELSAGPRSELVRDVARGRARRFERTLRIPPGKRHSVHVRAEATTPDGRVWTRGERLVILAGPLAVPDPPRRHVPDGRGGTLVEFEGRTQGAAR